MCDCIGKNIGAMSVVTDDTKSCGPHHTLMCLPESEIIPFAHYELIIMLYLLDRYSKEQAIEMVDAICKHSPDFVFDFKSKIIQFIKRSIESPYSARELAWFDTFANKHGIDIKAKLKTLVRYIIAR